MAKDPICGMTVKEDKGLKLDYQGQTYYFCAVGCKEKFAQNPEEFLRKGKE
jgi:YHS domain-containing protein